MLTTRDLLYNCCIQQQVHYCYYDYEKEKRIEISAKRAADCEIRFLYSENDEIYIEVELSE